MTETLKGAVHSKVQTAEDSWEGIYIKSRTGCYFEILKERRPGGLGIAIARIYPHYTDAAKIRELYPSLPWQSGTRSFPDGQPWFDWLSLGDYLNVEDTFFNAWAMKYHLSHRETGRPVSICTIDRFCQMELELGRENLETVRRLAAWLPGKKDFSDDQILFTVPDRDGNHLKIAASLIDGSSRFMELPRQDRTT